MKNLLLLYFIIIGLKASSQKSSGELPNFVEKKLAYFSKNNWKPFSGNLLVNDKDLGLVTKIKIENGLETESEMYKDKMLVRVLKNGNDVEIKNATTNFPENVKFTDTAYLNYKYVIISYKGSSNQKVKFNGVLEYDKTKLYYENGIRIKVEYFFDDNFKKIKERYNLFYTELGNIEYEDISDVYHGNYTKWNEEGNIIEKGKYELGKKIE